MPHNYTDHIENFIDRTGRAISWLTLGMVLIMFCVVVLRFLFNIGWVWFQELVNYLHAYVFMVGAAYTLKHDSHVRVDIFYQRMSPQQRARVDVLGSVFLLLPVCAFIFISSWPDVITAWRELEPSQRTGGLNFAYILKSVMLIMPSLLALQGIAVILKQMPVAFFNQPEDDVVDG